MQAFLATIGIVIPVVGFDFLKPVMQPKERTFEVLEFVIEHHSGVKATMVETETEFIVKAGSLAQKGASYKFNAYANLRQSLIDKKCLIEDGDYFRFSEDISFNSPSAASSVVLDRNSNGRLEWRLAGTKMTLTAKTAGRGFSGAATNRR
jgi:uncharacterized protein DUF4357